MLKDKEIEEFWKVFFKPDKIERFIDKISSLPTLRAEVFFLKICCAANPKLREGLINSEDYRVFLFLHRAFPLVTHADWDKKRMLFDRTVSWYVRCGLAQKIWEEI